MDDFLTRLYERQTGRLYGPLLIAAISVNALLGLALGVVAIRSFLEPTTSQLLVGGAAGLLATVVALTVVLSGYVGPDAKRLVDWSSADSRAAALETWNATTRLLHRDVAAGVVIFSVVFAPLALWMRAYLDLPWSSVPALYAAIEVSILFAATLDYFAVELMLRPLRRDVARHLPPDFLPEHRPISLRLRLLGVIVIASVATSMLVVSIAGPAQTPEARLTSGVGLALIVAATIGLLPASVLARSESLSRHALMRAARKVERGDLDAEIPLVASDETAVVAVSFNRMLAGLKEREALRDENVALVEELRRAAEELQASRARIVAASDEARRQVERDLHDGAQQNLVLLNLKLGLAERKLAENPDARELVAESRADLERALAELRELAHGIYPQVLTNDGLPGALATAANHAAIPVAVTSAGAGAGRYPPEVEAAVYFCCLEAVQNATKYGGSAASARITLSETAGKLVFEVADDGGGFDPADVDGGAGLQNMADRIGALGGELKIVAARGKGTRVTGVVPSTGATV